MKMPPFQPQILRNRSENHVFHAAGSGITPQGCNALEWVVCGAAIAGCGALTGPALVACVAAAAPNCVKCL